MSATLNSRKIADYFKIFDEKGKFKEAPILDLEIPRPFKRQIVFLDQLEGAQIGVKRDVINPEYPGISGSLYKVAVNLMAMIIKKSEDKSAPSFIVFLPGIQEIRRFKSELYTTRDDLNISEFDLTVLHSSISTDDFGKAFDRSIDRKIILATNIAESSVTLPGVRFVIDFCLTKYQETETATNISKLKLDWASKISLEQRAGRVGRTESGQVIRLIFKNHFENLSTETKPEIKRVSLESVVLKTKVLDMGKPSEILANAMDPPDKRAINDSILVLKEIGALEKLTEGGKFDKNDGNLTFTGVVMGKLPVDVRVSKLIILGYSFCCLKDCIIIGAGLSSKSVFKLKSPSTDDKIEEFHQKLEFARGYGSDLIATMNVYLKWREAVDKGLRNAAEKIWCQKQFLDLKNLRDMHDLVVDIKNRLKFFRLDEDHDRFPFTKDQKLFVLKMCIAGAFYPNYFMFGGSPPTRDVYSVLNNENPSTSVFFKGMQTKRLAQIYERQVRTKLQEFGVADDTEEMQVKFDSNSTRVIVEFKSLCLNGIRLPGDVRLEIYKAVKLGKLQRNLELKLMSHDNEVAYAKQMDFGSFKNQRFEWRKKTLKASSLCIYPKLSHNKIQGSVTHVSLKFSRIFLSFKFF